MYICMCTYIYICIHTDVYTHTHIYIYRHPNFMYMCIRVHIRIYISIDVYICIYVHMYICTYTFIHTDVYTHWYKCVSKFRLLYPEFLKTSLCLAQKNRPVCWNKHFSLITPFFNFQTLNIPRLFVNTLCRISRFSICQILNI